LLDKIIEIKGHSIKYAVLTFNVHDFGQVLTTFGVLVCLSRHLVSLMRIVFGPRVVVVVVEVVVDVEVLVEVVELVDELVEEEILVFSELVLVEVVE
jgi:hypothetical protein